jgi:YfiH family protein
MLHVKRQDQITFLYSEALGSVPGTIHAFSTRRGDRQDLTLGPHSSPNPMVHINRIRFLAAIHAPGWPIMKLKQVHSGIVADIDDTSSANDAIEADAAITILKGVMLAVQTADCVPILVSDVQGTAVAAIHAGWRGTAARIAETTILRLRQKFSIDPKDLTASIGPHIGVCCYEVGNDVVETMADPAVFEFKTEWTKPHLNLAAANRQQLLNAGLAEQRIEISTLCTCCRADLFHSYRRDGKNMGHMLSVIGIAP